LNAKEDAEVVFKEPQRDNSALSRPRVFSMAFWLNLPKNPDHEDSCQGRDAREADQRVAHFSAHTAGRQKRDYV